MKSKFSKFLTLFFCLVMGMNVAFGADVADPGICFKSANKNDAEAAFAAMSNGDVQYVGGGVAKLIATNSVALGTSANKYGYRCEGGRLVVVFNFTSKTTLTVYHNANSTGARYVELSSFSSSKDLKDISTSDYATKTAVAISAKDDQVTFGGGQKSSVSLTNNDKNFTYSTKGCVKITYTDLPAGKYVMIGVGSEAYLYGFSIETTASNPYTVTFNANGGDCDTESLKEETAGAGVTLPSATPADETTQEFKGWAASSSATSVDDAMTAGKTFKPTKDTTLYAIYGAKTVKSAIVYANTKDATNSNPTLYTEGVGIAEFAALADVDGFHFTGWNPSSISASATGEQTITAEWAKAPRTMFSLEMKSGFTDLKLAAGASQQIDATYATISGGSALAKNADGSNEKIQLLGTDGILFNGSNAYVYVDLNEALHEGDVIEFTSKNDNQICFTTNTTRATSIITSSKKYTIPAGSPLIGAYELYIWRNSSATYIKTLTIKTLADYAPVAYHSVTFDMQGATSAAIEAQSVRNGKKAVKPEDPEKTGVEFAGWVVAATDAAYDWNAAVTADVALKATWKEPAAVYYIAGNGTNENNWCGGKEWDANATGQKMSLSAGDVYTYSATVPAGEYKFKVATENWVASWGADNLVSTCGVASDGSDAKNIAFTTYAATTVTITFDPSKNTEEDSWKTISVAANKPLHAIPFVASSINGWAFDLMSESNGTKWQKTFKNVELAAGNIEFKYTKADNWDGGIWWDNGNGGNATYNVAEAGKYDVTFEYNPCTPAANVVLVKKATSADVTELTTWDWSKAASGTPALGDQGFKATENDQLMSMIAGIENSNNFKSDALIMGKAGDYAIRSSSNKCFQGYSIKFTTTVPGIVTINARRAGSGTSNLTIGDKNFGEIDTDTKDYVAAVAAGDVEISVTGNQPIRIYKITFTPTYTLHVTAAGWGTLCLPFATTPAETTTLYTGTLNGTDLNLTSQTEIPANTPLLVKATEGDYTFTAVDGSAFATIENNAFHGVMVTTPYTAIATETGKTPLALGWDAEGVVAFRQPKNAELPANRACLLYEGTPSAPIRIVLGEQVATDIESISTETAAQKVMINGQVYILRGEKLFDTVGRQVK